MLETILAAAGDPVPAWGQYGAIGVLLAAGLALWRYFVADIREARKETHDVWNRLATDVIPVLGQAVSAANHSASVIERYAGVLEQAVNVIGTERSARDSAERALLEERLRTATLRAELAEERARGSGGG